jgi:hypothetical protein
MTRSQLFRIGLATIFAGVTGLVAAVPPIHLGLATAASTLDGEPVGQVTVSGSVRVVEWLDLELSGTAIHTLERSYEDAEGRDFQSESAWSGIGIRPFMPLGHRVEVGLPIRSANGIVQFRYERPYRDDLRWTEEIIDRETVVVNSIGIDVSVAVSPNWIVRAEAGGRVSSPIRTVVSFDKGALNGWYAGVGAVYRLRFDS